MKKIIKYGSVSIAKTKYKIDYFFDKVGDLFIEDIRVKKQSIMKNITCDIYSSIAEKFELRLAGRRQSRFLKKKNQLLNTN